MQQVAQYERWLEGSLDPDEAAALTVPDGYDELRQAEVEQNALLMLAGGGLDDDPDAVIGL